MIDFESAQIKVNVLFLHKNIQIKKKQFWLEQLLQKQYLITIIFRLYQTNINPVTSLKFSELFS